MFRTLPLFIGAAFALLLGSFAPLRAQCLGESMTPGGLEGRRFFGASIALHDQLALVGDPEPSERAPAGSVGVFELAAPACWEARRWLQPARSARSLSFGYAIAAADRWLAVGAPALAATGRSVGRGAVHVFERRGLAYVETAVLQNPDTQAADRFGEYVATDGERIAVAARWSDLSAWTLYPAIFVYRKTDKGWEFESRIEGYGFGATLGMGLAIDGDLLIASAPNESSVDGDSAQTYVFRWGGSDWILEAQLTSERAPVETGFGRSLATWEGWIAVGAPAAGAGATGAGAVELFRQVGGAWDRVQVIEPARARRSGGFGTALEIANGRMIIGAPGTADRRTPGQVSLFALEGDVWRRTGAIESPDRMRSFGASVVLGGDEAIVLGRPSASAVAELLPLSITTPNCDGSGVCAPDCNRNDVPDDCDIAAGLANDCDLNGVPDECQTSPSEDCNGNGLLDACELAAGVAYDANENGVLDSCEPQVLRELMPLAVSSPWKSARAKFGSALAEDAQTLAVGAPGDESSGFACGAVYLYERVEDGWRLDTVLTPEDRQIGAAFGGALALDGDLLAIGASGQDDEVFDQGRVYLYRRTSDGWGLVETLEAEEPRMLDHYGRTLRIAGGELYVGAPGHGGVFDRTSTVYVYAKDRRGWYLEQSLIGIERFGSSIVVEGKLMFVGAPSSSQRDLQTPGSVHVFDRTRGSWEWMARLEAMGRGERGDRFGASLAWQGQTLLVGAPEGDAGRGLAYVYYVDGSRRTGFPMERLAPAGRSSGNRFGASVALLGEDWALVGAPGFPGYAAGSAGSIYVFEFVRSFVFSARVDPLLSATADRSVLGFGSTIVATGIGDFATGAPGGEFETHDVEGRVSEWRVPERAPIRRSFVPDARLVLVPALVGRAYWECGPMYALENFSPMGARGPLAWLGASLSTPFLEPNEAPMFDAIFNPPRSLQPSPIPSVAPAYAALVIGAEWERSYVVADPQSWRWAQRARSGAFSQSE